MKKIKEYDNAYFEKAMVPLKPEEIAEQKVPVSPAEPEQKNIVTAEIKPEKLNEAYDVLDSAIDFAKAQKKLDPSMACPIVELSARAIHFDPTVYSAEALLPLYQKQTEVIEACIRKLSPEDEKQLSQSLKNRERELKSGNG